MAATNETTNYGLPQWESTDKPERTDFNQAFDAIDTTVNALTDKTDIKVITDWNNVDDAGGLQPLYSALGALNTPDGNTTSYYLGFQVRGGNYTIQFAIRVNTSGATQYVRHAQGTTWYAWREI